MNFNSHLELEGRHAFLSPSNYHWINYSDDKLLNRYSTWQEAARGTELHLFASSAIRLGQRLRGSRKTLNMYVNDAIGFKMKTEQPLVYSYNCFGTADAIAFKSNFLRIHDLKNGVTPASMKQLMVYCALFCLEYRYRPGEIGVELRIYQNDDIDIYTPDVDEIAHIMDKIITFDKLIDKLRIGEDRD